MISGGFPIPTPKPIPAAPVADAVPVADAAPPRAPPPSLPPELEARIEEFERAAPRPDFDAASWLWMMLLGIAIPLALLIIGWWA
jgi:hypothetical protein